MIFLHALITSLLQSDALTLLTWLDGPTCKFKNRFIANCLQWFEAKFAFRMHRNFFSTSHGKGPVDGTHLTFTCSNSTIETLEKGVKYVQS